MAEAILNKLSEGRFKAFSAGTHPASKPNPHALAFLQVKGYATSNLIPKQIGTDVFNPGQAPDFVFTLCDLTANEDCPAWSGLPVTGHWVCRIHLLKLGQGTK
jgi:protein-tyrosine-phosphatase